MRDPPTPRPVRATSAILVAVILTGCNAPGPPAAPTDIADYVMVRDNPAVVLSDGSTFLLENTDDLQAVIDQFPVPPSSTMQAGIAPAQLPGSVDLRANQTPIKNQGGRNTCVAFATVAGIEAAYLRLESMTLDLSEQYANHIQKATALPVAMVELPRRETQLGAWGGSGVSYQLGWLFRLKFGLPLDNELAYVSTGNYEDTDQDGDVPRLLWSDTTYSQRLVDQWNLEDDEVTYNIPAPTPLTNLPRNVLENAIYGVSSVAPVSPINLINIKQALADGREVVFTVDLTKPAEGENEFQAGVWVPTSDPWGSHAMVIVGYDDATSSFMVKNSWGLEAGTGRGQPAAADLDADGFISMSYDWVPKIREALVVLDVRDAATWTNSQPVLGDWSTTADFTHLARMDGRLAIYHIPGAFPASALSGATDSRFGTYYDGSEEFRVNGHLGGTELTHLQANFVRPGGAPETYDFDDGLREIDAFLLGDSGLMAGNATTAGATVAFYASLDGRISGVSADTTGPVDENDYLGSWRFVDGDSESTLRLGDVSPSGTILGRLENGSTAITGITAELDASDPCQVTIEIPHAGGARTYLGRMFCVPTTLEERNVIAGSSSAAGGATQDRGFLAIRTGSAVTVEITSPTEGASFPRGSTNVPLEVEAFGADEVVWTSDLDGMIGAGTTTAVNDLSYGSHVITATATAADGGTASDSVSITITNDAPSVEIVEPSGAGSYCVDENITFSATVTDLNEVPTFTLSDDDVEWRVAGGAVIGLGKSRVHSFDAAGGYNVVVRATDSQGAFDEDSVNLSVEDCPENQPPTVSITLPAADTDTDDPDFEFDGFDDGREQWFKDVDLAGVANDPEDGALAGASLAWITDRSDLQTAALGTGTSLTVRLYADSCTGEWHQVSLTATDSDGAARTVVRRIFIWTLC
ncbi:MAG TPA: hypothetical protein VFF10_10690 [Trueperaceae bacterium]|nr:hypothetical protein [Trueperaceae bacterium]